jgi:F0F1-type ATP synthase membrane subunit b/b'
LEILNLNNAATATIVLGFCGGVFSYFILRPLNNAIVELRVAVRELRSDLRTAEERRQQLEIKVAEIDQRAKAAHNRLDEMIKRGVRQ